MKQTGRVINLLERRPGLSREDGQVNCRAIDDSRTGRVDFRSGGGHN
jgi:ribosomal protein S28E/S33